MIRDEEIAAQLVRLSCLRSVPESTAEVSVAYRRAAKDAEHASRITDALLRAGPFFPTPHEVYEMAEATPPDAGMRRPDRKCPACDGTGYAQVWLLETTHKTPAGAQYVTKDTIESAEEAAKLRAALLSTAQKGVPTDQKVWDMVRRCPRCQVAVPARSDRPQPAAAAAPPGGRGGPAKPGKPIREWWQ